MSCRGVAGKDGSVTKYTFEEALMAGYAPDGGMFLPERVPKISKATLRSWASLSYSQVASPTLTTEPAPYPLPPLPHLSVVCHYHGPVH